MKICSICKNEKLLHEFPLKQGKIRPHCKTCAKEMSRRHYQNNKKYYYNRNKNKKQDNRQNLLDFLDQNPCVDCGETNPILLEFDHNDPKTKTHNIARMLSSHTWTSILGEIEKCSVRCVRCHRLKTSKQFGWYKSR
jgi:hypothetical protein